MLKQKLQELSQYIFKYREVFSDLIILIQSRVKKNQGTGHNYILKEAIPIKLLLSPAINELIKPDGNKDYIGNFDLNEKKVLEDFKYLISINEELKKRLYALFLAYENNKRKFEIYSSKTDSDLKTIKIKVLERIDRMIEIISTTKENGYKVLTFEDANSLRRDIKITLEAIEAIIKILLYQLYPQQDII